MTDNSSQELADLEAKLAALKLEETSLEEKAQAIRDRLAKQATVTAARRGIAALKPH